MRHWELTALVVVVSVVLVVGAANGLPKANTTTPVNATILSNAVVNSSTVINSTAISLTPIKNAKPIYLTPEKVINLKNLTVGGINPNIVVKSNITEAFKKAGVNIYLVPLYHLNIRAGSIAMYPYCDVLLVDQPLIISKFIPNAETTYYYLYSPWWCYDNKTHILIFSGVLSSYDMDTGSIIDTISSKNITVAKVLRSGEIEVLQEIPYTLAGTGGGYSSELTPKYEEVYNRAQYMVLTPAGIIASTTNGLAVFPMKIEPDGNITFGSSTTLIWNGTSFIKRDNKNPDGQPSILLEKISGNIFEISKNRGWEVVLGGVGLIDLSPSAISLAEEQNNVSLLFVSEWGSKLPDNYKFIDAPVQLPLSSSEWLIASKGAGSGAKAVYGNVSNPNGYPQDIAVVNLGSGNYNLVNETPIDIHYTFYNALGYTYPESSIPLVHYISCSETKDDDYVMLLKITHYQDLAYPMGVYIYNAVYESVPVRLEVWSNGGGSLSLVTTLNYSLSGTGGYPFAYSCLQPVDYRNYVTIDGYEIHPFVGGVVVYHNGDMSFYGFASSQLSRFPGVAAVSPDGSYLAIGNTVYEACYYLTLPSIIYNGRVNIYNGAKDKNLNSTITYNIPSGISKYNYTMRVLSGKIYIGSIYSKKRCVDLVTDKKIMNGVLYDMYKRGLIRAFQYTNIAGNGDVKKQKLVEGTVKGLPDPHVLDYVRIHELKPWAPYIAVGKVGSAIDINVPFNDPVPASQFSSVKLHMAMTYGTIVPEYEASKLFGIFVNQFGVGATSAIGGYLAWQALKKYAPRVIFDQLPVDYGELVPLTSLGETASIVLSKAVPIIGIATIVDGVAGYIMNHNAMANTEMQTYMMVVPVFVDNSGHRYAIVTLVLPNCANSKDWDKYAGEMLEKIGIHNYIIRHRYIGETWKDYQQLLAHASKKELEKAVNLIEGLNDLASRYNIQPSDLKLVGCHVFIATLTSGRLNLWSWLSGKGLSFMVITAVRCGQLSATGVIPAQTVTNPKEICDILNPIYINGQKYLLKPEGDCAVATFRLPVKCQKIVLQVNKPYYAAMTMTINAQIIAPLYKKIDGLYETNFTYSWKYNFNESKIMFAAMPYPMCAAYETVYTTHGNEPVNMTPYMSLIAKINDTTSPTGVRYYYGTTTAEDMRLIDPHNAGMMEPGKRYHIEYWYKSPIRVKGDASIHVMFNGTTLSSTLPRHARVIINSSRSQTVYGYLQVIVGYEDQKSHQFHTVDTHTFDFALRVGANGSTYKEWDIQKYVGEAIHQYALGKVGYVKLVGKITKAAYDSVKTNDFDSLVYYPPSTLTKTKPIILTIDVLNAITHAPVSGAKVVFDNKNAYTTNAAGLTNITTTSGYHSVVVNATGYYTKKTGVLAYTNMTFYVYLIPKNGNYVILPPNGTTPNTTWVAPNGTTSNGTPPGAPPLPVGKNNTTGWTSIPIIYNTTNHTYLLPVEVVVQYLNGMPVQGATVKFLNATTGALINAVETDGTGYAYTYVPEYYNLTVNVTYTSANYTSQRTVFVDHPLIVQFTLPINSKYFEPEVAVNNISIWIHEGLGQIPIGLKTYPVYHCVDTWFYTNTPQNITFEVWLVNIKTNETIASGTFTVHLHKGFQRVREFIPVNVSDFTTCQVFCKITKYQYDTNPYNNYAAGNIVTFRPYIDIYTTIVWEPLKQKTEYGLLPGDTVKICVALHVPEHTHVPDIHLKYDIMSNEVGKHKMKMVTARSYTVNSAGGVSTIWYNYTMQLPWTNKVVVTANATCPYDLGPENNNASAVIPLSPDAALVSARVQSIAVSGGSVVPVRVAVRSNYINTQGYIMVIDESYGNATIGSRAFNITAPLQTVIVNVHVPKIKKYFDTHTWMVYVTEGNDPYSKDGIHEISVTIFGIPSWIVLVAIFLFVMLVLLIVRHLLTIRPPRQGRYFKRVDGGSRDSFGSAKIHYRKGEGKFFRKIK